LCQSIKARKRIIVRPRPSTAEVVGYVCFSYLYCAYGLYTHPSLVMSIIDDRHTYNSHKTRRTRLVTLRRSSWTM
jgi:hypothetical protein